jgi:RND superfamily putative drug exporter
VDHAPIVVALVFTTTMILLFFLTGSVILPLKTFVMNILSIAAAFGILVVVFQDGFGSDLFAYDGPRAIETALLVVVGATTFGLATDYAVLVLARIKEYHDEGKDNESAVALGIERTGRVITAAALLLAVVFLAFTSSSIFFMKEVGFAQAMAVLIDASIVRALLVPALMRLLGDWNWWAPGPLRRVHSRLGLAER